MITFALIEINAFHDECLYSQVQYLKGPNHHITLICNAALKSRTKSYDGVDRFVYIDLSTKWKKYLAWYKIWRLINGQMSRVIFNTGEIYIYKLLLFPFKDVELIGVLHNAQKLKRKKQISISNKLDKYLVLGDFIKNSIENENLTTTPIGVFYPAIFPEVHLQFQKPKDEIWISIPGAVELDKRDYESLFNLKLEKHVKLILLGAPKTEKAIEFIERIHKSNLANNCITFDSFISNEIFHTYIKQSDFILPLIHPNNAQFSAFLKYKITGSYNLAIAYRIPLLLEQAFINHKEYQECAYYYDSRSINTLFNIMQSTKKLYASKHWDFEHQQNKYLNFVLSNNT